MMGLYPHKVDFINTTNGGLLFDSQIVNHAIMKKQNEPTEYEAIGKRLAAIRSSEGVNSQKDWAEFHGFGVSQYNNWEKGIRRITVDEAERLCNLYGLSLDFIYRGNISGVPEKIKNLL